MKLSDIGQIGVMSCSNISQNLHWISPQNKRSFIGDLWGENSILQSQVCVLKKGTKDLESLKISCLFVKRGVILVLAEPLQDPRLIVIGYYGYWFNLFYRVLYYAEFNL